MMRQISQPLRRPIALTAACALIWVLMWFDWVAWYQLPEWFQFVVFTAALGVTAWWIRWARTRTIIPRRAIYSICFVPAWHWAVFATHAMAWMTLRAALARFGLAVAFMIGLGWVVWYVDRKARIYQLERRAIAGTSSVGPLGAMGGSIAPPPPDQKLWNPIDLDAWYYGDRRQKLNQSLATLFGYGLAFALIVLFLLRVAGCKEIYEMPAGGGEQKPLQQVVKIQKVIKKKFVINPFSAVLFNPPPIDEVKLQLMELTKHRYKVGYGKGAGSGFAGGTRRGMVRFIRLEYAGGDWDQDFGVGADLNMLIEYGVRTSHKVAKVTESRKIAQLKNFPVGKSPPIVYMTGQRAISVSKSEIKILREYLIEKHGMIFGDNGGSNRWHGQFFGMMRRVLPQIEPVRVPLDHVIHRVPFGIPFLPYVAPHGGKDAWGWVVDGRLAVYYHPGDIGDAWADGHAGVKRPIWEACYQLGTNIIFYAHAEYNRWLDSRKPKDD